MKRPAALLWLLLPAAAGAHPAVEIVSPAAGSCVSAGQPVLPGTPGGQPVVPPADVPLRLRLTESAGAALDVTVTVDGQVVLQDTYRPSGGAAELTDAFTIPAAAIQDGARDLTVTVASGGEHDAAEVRFTVDRSPPDVTFAAADLARIGACFDAPPAIQYQVADALDPAPAVDEVIQTQGCDVDRVITVRDHCGAGNAQRIAFRTRRTTNDPIAVHIGGVSNGASVLAPVVTWSVDAAQDCVDHADATLTQGQEAPAPLVSGAEIDAPGNYVAVVQATACGRVAASTQVAFTVVPPPSADAGGPYLTQQGAALTLDASGSTVAPSLGHIVEYAWDLNGDQFYDADEGRGVQVPFNTNVRDGVYNISLRITTDAGYVDYDYTTVTIGDVNPTCNAGGPYEAQQGVPVTFDASGSRAGDPREPILSYGWDFGDDRFPQLGAGLVHPTHLYADEGDYTVTLTVSDVDSSCQGRAQVHVGDVSPVIRNARARDADRLVEGVPVLFTAAQTSAGSDSEPITSYRWEFGDGSPPAEGPDLRGPSHTYAHGGTFNVCLSVSDTDSTVRQCFDVVVADLNPTAHLDGPSFAIEGEVVTFDAGRSRAGGDADPLRQFVWDFDDGSEPVVVNDLGQTRIDHVFLRDGELTVTLTVLDQDSQAVATLDIFVDDAIPTAAFAVDAGNEQGIAFEGLPVTLDGGSSAAGGPGDPIVDYAWDFGDGERASGAVAHHAFPDDGTYEVRLTVRDSDGSLATASRFVDVRNRPPANVRVVSETPLVESGRDATFRVSYDDAPGDVPRITWTLGDGTSFDGADRVTHRYGAPGAYTVRVTVDDGDGGVVGASIDVTVEAAGPIIGAPAVVQGAEDQPLSFDVDVQAAENGFGGVDGPVAVTVPLAPTGATWNVEDVSDAERRLHVAWTPGQQDAGDHRLRIVARSPAGVVRSAEVTIHVAEAGTPLLAAVGGAVNDGHLTVYGYRYDPVRRLDRFQLLADLPLGAAAGALAVTPDGRRLFATVPGAGVVAVAITTGDAPRLVRRIPVGGTPVAVVYGGGDVWVLDAGTARLIDIDADRLKVRTVIPLPGRDGLVDAAWLPGASGDRLLAVSQTTGDLLVIDPHAPGDVVVATEPLGGRLQRVVVDADGDAWVADGKGRRLLRVPGADLLAGDANVRPDATPLQFPPRDLAVDGRVIWTAGRGGLGRLDEAGVYRDVRPDPLDAVAVLPATLYGVPAIAVGSRSGVENLTAAELESLAGSRGAGARRLLSFSLSPNP
jgi:PKD repeat protein